MSKSSTIKGLAGLLALAGLIGCGEPTIEEFTASKAVITEGDSTSLIAKFKYGFLFASGKAEIDGNVGKIENTGLVTITPQKSGTYTLTVKDEKGRTVTRTVEIRVVPKPVINSFSASPSDIMLLGGITYLITMSWSVSNAESISIDNGIGDVKYADGSVKLKEHHAEGDYYYTLTARNAAGFSVDAKVKIHEWNLRHDDGSIAW